MSMSLQELSKQFTDIMTKPNASEQDKRQELFQFALSIGACTRHPSRDAAPASQAELINHILTKFQMMGLVDISIHNAKQRRIAWISAIIALVAAFVSVFGAIVSWYK